MEYRRAEALLRSKKFLEAIKCHENAAALLKDALEGTDNPRSVESMKLQRDFHIRQKDIIMMHKKQYNLRNSERNRTKNLPDAIHETLEKTDLLLVLLREGGEADMESLKSMTPSDCNNIHCAGADDSRSNDNNTVMMVLKHAKDKYVVVEELVTLNEQLHAHVYSLVEQLEMKERELSVLRERIATLETTATLDNGNNNNSSSSKGVRTNVDTPEQLGPNEDKDTDRSAL